MSTLYTDYCLLFAGRRSMRSEHGWFGQPSTTTTKTTTTIIITVSYTHLTLPTNREV